MKAYSTQFKPVAWFGAPILAFSFILSACGSSNDESSPSNDDPIPLIAAEPNLAFHSVKTFRFSWTDVADASHYKLWENPDGLSGFTQVGGDVLQGIEHVEHIVPLYARTNAQYLLQSCSARECVDSAVVSVSGTLENSVGYIKTSTADVHDQFGHSVSLSADGNTLAVGAPYEGSNATGVNGDQNNDFARWSGAVYVFAQSGGTWRQQGYIKASNTDDADIFGYSVSLSADGNLLAVGSVWEDSSAIGVNGDQADDSSRSSGAVYMFTRSDSTWKQQAYIKSSNTDSWDRFGYSVSLSDDGTTLAVGAYGEDSSAKGVDGNQSDNTALESGAVYVFIRNGDIWNQQAYLKASNADPRDDFGRSVSLSGDGDTLAVGAVEERSLATGINGDQSDNSAWEPAGAVYVFTRRASDWRQQAYIKASNTDVADRFGYSVSLSGDGKTLAVGASNERSNATGVDGDQSDNSADKAGAVYVFTQTNSTWNQQVYLKASNTDPWDGFGWSVSLNGDGKTLAVGARGERSNATGINSDQGNNSLWDSGAVYVFTQSNGEWSQQAYLKASNPDAGDFLGGSVSLTGDGSAMAVGALGEDSSATGVGGDQSDNSSAGSGAVYLF